MSKRLKVLLILLCMGLLSGCGAVQNVQTDESTINKDNTEEADAEQIQEEAEDAIDLDIEDKIEPIVVKTHDYYSNIWDDDSTELLYELSMVGIATDADQYPELARALEDYNIEHMNMLNEIRNDFEASDEEKDDYNSDRYYSATWSIEVNRADTRVLSFYSKSYQDTGGVHGMYALGGYNFDTVTGKVIELEDIVSDYSKLQDIVLERLKNLGDDYFLYDEYEEYVKDIFDPSSEYQLNWVLNKKGIQIWFNPYDIAPYATGVVSIDITYDEYSGLIGDYYCLSGNDDANQIMEYDYDYGMIYRIDLDDDGQEDIIKVEQDISCGEYEDGTEYDSGVEVIISIGQDEEDVANHSVRLDPNYKLDKCYVVTSEEGKHYVYVEFDSYSYGDDLYVVDVNDLENGPSVVGWVDYGAIYDMPLFDANCFYLHRELYMMGEYECYRRYKVGQDGMPEPIEDEYIILPTAYQKLFGEVEGLPIKMEFTDDKVLKLNRPLRYYWSYDNRDHKSDGEYRTFNAGTMLYPCCTDGEKYITFKTNDGLFLDLRFDELEEGDWGERIQGYNPYQLFSGGSFDGY